MKLVAGLFVLSLASGQLLSWTIQPGVVIYSHDILLVLLLLWAYAKQQMRGNSVRLLHPLYAFFLVCVVSLIVHFPQFGTTLTLLSSLYLVRWFVYSEIYVFIATSKQDYPWLDWLYGTSVLFAIFGLGQYFLYPDLRNLVYLGWDPHYYRLFSTVLDPNFAGIILVLGFFLGLTFWDKRWRRPLLILGELLLFGSLLLTYSRSSYVALIVGVVTYAFLTKKKSHALGILLLFFGAIAVLPLRDVDILRLDRAESAMARVGNWQRGMGLFAESPVIGWGFNTLRYVQMQRHWVDDSQIISRAGGGLDNSFIFLLATTGIVGLLTYLWVIQSMVRLGNHSPDRHVGIILVTSLAAVGAHAFFINSLFYPQVMIWLWILAGSAEREKELKDVKKTIFGI